jgi:hypothetical protein
MRAKRTTERLRALLLTRSAAVIPCEFGKSRMTGNALEIAAGTGARMSKGRSYFSHGSASITTVPSGSVSPTPQHREV